jgi:8-oxo-dGTP diphosphatase
MIRLGTLCYVRRDGKTLMVHRIKKPDDMHWGEWNGLGGKLELGETPEECARREILEESGLVVKHLDYKGLLTFPQFSNQDDWYAFVFVVTAEEGKLIDSPEGRLEWIEDKDLLDLNLWEGDRLFIPWLNRPGIFSGKLVYRDGILIDHEVEFYDSSSGVIPIEVC